MLKVWQLTKFGRKYIGGKFNSQGAVISYLTEYAGGVDADIRTQVAYGQDGYTYGWGY